MNTETVNLVAVLVLGVVGLAAIIAMAYAKGKGDETLTGLLGPYQRMAGELIDRADRALVPYGDELKPVNELVGALQTLLDSDDDTLVKVLPSEVILPVKTLLGQLRTLTDGQPPVDVASLQDNA